MNRGDIDFMLTRNLLTKYRLIKKRNIVNHWSDIWDNLGHALVPNNCLIPFNVYRYKLNCLKNNIILGAFIFYRCTEDFKGKILVHDDRFVIEEHMCVVKLLHEIQNKVYVATKVSCSNLKLALKRADLSAFDFNVSKLLIFFIKTWKEVKFDTGDEKCDKYVRLFFSVLKTAPSNSFNILVISEKNY